jgi:hypothetical protein
MLTLGVRQVKTTHQQPQEMPATALHWILCALVASLKFLDGQMRFKRDASCYVSVLQRSDAMASYIRTGVKARTAGPQEKKR